MIAQRHRPYAYALGCLVIVWLLAWGGYSYSAYKKVTAEKVAAYLNSIDLRKLSGETRARALQELAAKMNALSREERRKARLSGAWDEWFMEMTEQEKGEFIESTMPSGFKQMISAFEELPADKRKRAMNDALKELKRTRDTIETEDPGFTAGNDQGPALSPELQDKVVQIGLKTFYAESSAQTKAEMAPVLEEMQRLMENGRLFRRERREN